MNRTVAVSLAIVATLLVVGSAAFGLVTGRSGVVPVLFGAAVDAQAT